jgi:hypothetical protein
VLVGNLTLTSVANGTDAEVIANEERLASELLHLPGATGVAFAYDHPLEANWTDVFSISGTAAAKDDLQGTAQLRIVSPSYFETMDVAVLDGRALNARDDLNAPGAVVVNEAFVRNLAEGHALNRILRSGTPRSNSKDPRVPAEFRIVGVVENERFRGLEQAPEPAVYMSTHQFPQSQIAMLIRTSGDPASIAREARDRIQRLDPGVAVEHVAPLATILAEQLVTRRGTTHVIDGFAAVTLGLAALGLYGLLALLVAGRRRETGIRLALGSSPKHEAARVLRDCLGSTGLGVACGIGLALVSGRLVQSLLVGVSPRDMATLSTVAAALMIVGVAAASLPAWRAARVDPASVLRGDS